VALVDLLEAFRREAAGYLSVDLEDGKTGAAGLDLQLSECARGVVDVLVVVGNALRISRIGCAFSFSVRREIAELFPPLSCPSNRR
jgi:hypothetical protein